MRSSIVCVFASAGTFVSGASCLAGIVPPQLEFRIVERTGQTTVTPGDNVLDFAVQVRTIAGRRVAAAGFDMRIVGEAESSGVLTRSQISNFDGTYFAGIAVNNTVGLGGVARHFSYYPNVNSAFNGAINTSAGSFTNTPDQDIGLVIGAALDGPLLNTPGLDVDGDGNPDTWSGNGTGVAPTPTSTASVPVALRGPYFGEATFIDLYRFRYTVTNLSARSLNLTLSNISGNIFQVFGFGPGLWGPISTVVDPSLRSATGLQIQVIPAPATGGLLAFGAMMLTRRRR